MSPTEREKEVPRVVFFGGKAASGYRMAKRIIKLIHRVSYKVCILKTKFKFCWPGVIMFLV